FAGSGYVASAWLLPLFMWTNVPSIIFFWTHPYLLSIGLPQYSSFANIVGRIVGIAVFSALLVFSSLPGAAIGSGLPACFATALALWFIGRFARGAGAALRMPRSALSETVSSGKCS